MLYLYSFILNSPLMAKASAAAAKPAAKKKAKVSREDLITVASQYVAAHVAAHGKGPDDNQVAALVNLAAETITQCEAIASGGSSSQDDNEEE